MKKTIPEEVLLSIEKELEYLNFGKLCLEILIHDKKPRFRILKEISIITEKKTSGEQKKENKTMEEKNEYK